MIGTTSGSVDLIYSIQYLYHGACSLIITSKKAARQTIFRKDR